MKYKKDVTTLICRWKRFKCVHLGNISETHLSMLGRDMVVADCHVEFTTNIKGRKTVFWQPHLSVCGSWAQREMFCKKSYEQCLVDWNGLSFWKHWLSTAELALALAPVVRRVINLSSVWGTLRGWGKLWWLFSQMMKSVSCSEHWLLGVGKVINITQACWICPEAPEKMDSVCAKWTLNTRISQRHWSWLTAYSPQRTISFFGNLVHWLGG